MKVKSILNNSSLIALNDKGEEIILIGKGISFNKRPNDDVDTSKIEKMFQMNTSKSNDLMEVIENVPEKYLEITNTIVRYAQKKLKKDLDKSIYITLTDHIYGAIERYNEGVVLNFGMLMETEQLYPEEFKIAQWSIDYVNAACDVELPEDEAGFISIHIISAVSHNDDLSIVNKVTKIVKDVTKVVEDYYGNYINKNSLSFSRFITHLKYFSLRYLNHDQIGEEEGPNFLISDYAIEQTEGCIEW